MKRFLLGLLVVAGSANALVDLTVFSKDRAMQIDAFLESAQEHLSGVASITVIYKASTTEFDRGYDVARRSYESDSVRFIRQDNTKNDFKEIVMSTLERQGEYVVFAVDDIVIKAPVDLEYCQRILSEDNTVHGFFLRCGLNITKSYPDIHTAIPKMEVQTDSILKWRIGGAEGVWGYPNTVDMTVYRKAEVVPVFARSTFNNPNTLEGEWSKYKRPQLKRGASFLQSKIINIPANIVNESAWRNPFMDSFDAVYLQERYDSGYKIDVKRIYSVPVDNSHTDYEYTFVNQ